MINDNNSVIKQNNMKKKDTQDKKIKVLMKKKI